MLATRANLQQDLIQLKELCFDKIEDYKEYEASDVGFRSLKNIGVWLSVFAMTENKLSAMSKLMQLADIKDTAQQAQLTEVINRLAVPENIQQIIQDYEQSGGTFSIEVKAELYKTVLECVQKTLPQLVNYVKKSDKPILLGFGMENIIIVSWLASEGKRAAKYAQKKGRFTLDQQEAMIDYLETDASEHDTAYQNIQHGEYNYHLIRLGVLRNDRKEYCYLIEPENNKTLATAMKVLQKDYFSILTNIEEKKYLSANISFPELKGKLRTEEHRLGPYQIFLNEMIANISADLLEYNGIRELSYNNEGVKIYNKEEMVVLECATFFEPVKHHVSKPFFFAHCALDKNQELLDIYPFAIYHPHAPMQINSNNLHAVAASTKKNEEKVLLKQSIAELKTDNINLDISVPVKSWSPKYWFGSKPKLSLREYLTKMIDTDYKKAISITEALQNHKSEAEIKSALGQHRGFIRKYINVGSTVGLSIYNQIAPRSK